MPLSSSSKRPTTVQSYSIVQLPPVTPSSLNGPVIPAPCYAFSPFWDTFYQASVRGFWGGLITGTVVGTIVPIIGNIVGAGIGLIIGCILGGINGVMLGTLNMLCFASLRNIARYRWATYTIGVVTTMVTTLLVCSSTAISDSHGVSGFVIVVVVIIFIYSFYACHHIVAWYIAANPPIVQPSVLISPYEPAYVQQLFDDMRDSYERMSDICSFGFNRRWRRQLIDMLNLQPGMQVWDAMSGTGETWRALLPRIGTQGTIVAVDFAPTMVAAAQQRARSLGAAQISVYAEDALHTTLPAQSVDSLVCAYGLKTLRLADQEVFVDELLRVLKPGSVFGMVEIGSPRNKLLRALYLGYLRFVVPILGALFLGSPASYRMLGRYLRDFDNGVHIVATLQARGCTARRVPLFGGCAVALIGMTPNSNTM